jgi:hypothetical protein
MGEPTPHRESDLRRDLRSRPYKLINVLASSIWTSLAAALHFPQTVRYLPAGYEQPRFLTSG